MASKIEWTDETWNVHTGCTKVSEGCRNCYAERVMKRFQPERKFTEIRFHEGRLEKPLRWKKPRMVFVNSMSDLFHETIRYDVIDKLFAAMAIGKQHVFQILTKRPYVMKEYLESRGVNATFWKSAAADLGYTFDFEGYSFISFPLRNVWLGVSVEDQKTADERIPILADIPAAVRFVSCEPLLGPIDFGGASPNPLNHLDWVIVGGESGPKHRPMNPEWARSILEQCRAAYVPFFMKQIDKVRPIPDDLMIREWPGTQRWIYGS